jgi:hypothetical protein
MRIRMAVFPLVVALVAASVVFGTSSCSCSSAATGLTAGVAESAGAAGCSDSGGSGGGGNAPGAPQCEFNLQMNFPTDDQFIASANVTCNVPIATASTTLTIDYVAPGTSSGAAVVRGEKTKTSIPPFTITTSAECLTGSWTATASITGTAVDGAPIPPTSETTDPIIINSGSDCA